MSETQYTPNMIDVHAVCSVDHSIVGEVKGQPFLNQWKGLSVAWARQCIENIFDALTLDWNVEDLSPEEDKEAPKGYLYSVRNFTEDSGNDFMLSIIQDDDDPEVLTFIGARARQDMDIPVEWSAKYIAKKEHNILPDYTWENRPCCGNSKETESEYNDTITTYYELFLTDCIRDYFGDDYVSDDFKFKPKDKWDQAKLIHYAAGRLHRFMCLMVQVLKQLAVHDNLCYALRVATMCRTTPVTLDETLNKESEEDFLARAKETTEKEVKFLKALFEKVDDGPEEGEEEEDDEDDDEPLTDEQVKNHPLNVPDLA